MSVVASRAKRRRERVKSQALNHLQNVFTVKDKDAIHALLDRVRTELQCKEKSRKDNLLVGVNECIKRLEKEEAISLVILAMVRKKKSNLSFNELLGHVERICSETGTYVIRLHVSRKILGQAVCVKTASMVGVRGNSSLVEFLLSLATTPSSHSTQQLSETIPMVRQNTTCLKQPRRGEREMQKDENTVKHYPVIKLESHICLPPNTTETLTEATTMSGALRQVVAKKGFAVLDGAMGTELESRGVNVESHLWSAGTLMNEDGRMAVAEVHKAYLDAGADIITAASYQASYEGFQKAGVDDATAEVYMRESVQIAMKTRDAFVATSFSSCIIKPIVAVSIGSYGAAMADGSEYQGYGNSVTKTFLKDWHRRRLRILSSSGGDLLAFETIPELKEVEAILDVLDEEVPDGMTCWISVCCRDGTHLSSGEELSRVPTIILASSAWKHKRIDGIGVNCVTPKFVSHCLRVLSPEFHCQALGENEAPYILVCYPNSGENWDAVERKWVGDGTWKNELIHEWQDAGARVMGGCCRTTPKTIQVLRSQLVSS